MYFCSAKLPKYDKKESVDFILKTLNELFPEPPIPLAHKDPYTLLIAVLLSAQSTDARVNIITPKLLLEQIILTI